MVLTSHAIVAAVELAFYILVLAPTIHNLIHYGIKQNTSWLFLMIYSMVKIAGAAMFLYISIHPDKASTTLQIATQTLYAIALGPLLSSTLSFLNPRDPKDSKSAKTQTPISKILRLVHIVVLVAVGLGISGGIDRAPNSHGQPGKNYDSGATKLKVSAILLLVAFLGICLGALVFTVVRKTLQEPQHTLIIYVLFALPLLLVRVIYSLLSAFNLSTTKAKKTTTWNMFTGSIAAYVLMGMVAQFGIVILYTVGGYVARDRVRRNEWGVQRTGVGRQQELAAGQESYRMVDDPGYPAQTRYGAQRV